MLLNARRLSTFAAVAALAVSVAACDIAVDGSGGLSLDLAAGKAQDQWTRSYPVEAGARVELINVNGRIAAETTDGKNIEIQADRTAKAGSDDAARELLGKIEMREEVSPQRVRVEVRAPRMSGAMGHEFKWTIKVPRGVAVDLRTINGGIHLTGLNGEVRARSTNGGIKGMKLVATSVDAEVTNGGVDIELLSVPASGTFTLQAVNGGVSVAVPGDAKAEFTARVTNGGIAVSDLDLAVQGEQNRRRLDGTLNGGGARIALETVNGGVKIGRTNAGT